MGDTYNEKESRLSCDKTEFLLQSYSRNDKLAVICKNIWYFKYIEDVDVSRCGK